MIAVKRVARLSLLAVISLFVIFGFNSPTYAATAPSPVIEPIVIDQTKSSVKITWQVPADGGSPITDYVIEMRTIVPSISWRAFNDGVSSSNEATITGLTRGVQYQFRVSAKNAVGTSSATNVVKPRILASKIASTNHSMCGLDASGAVYCWGMHREIGVPYSSSHDYQTMYRKGLTDGFTEISGGTSHYCALHPQEGVMCWGGDFSEVFGGSSMENGTPISFPSGVVPEKVFAGGTLSCITTTNDSVYCWGFNGRGQLGRGFTSTSEAAPGVVTGLSQVVNLTLGSEFACSVHLDSSVKCWGYNFNGQLGRGTYTAAESTPATVSGVASSGNISSGGGHVCAVTISKSVSCWGSNQSAQLGDPSLDYGLNKKRAWPVEVSGLSNIAEISSGGGSVCALNESGFAYCWGTNNQGQIDVTGLLGSPVRSPRGPSVVGFETIEMGDFHGCGIRGNSTVYCWGVFEVQSWVSLPTTKGVQGDTVLVLPITAPDKPVAPSITSRSHSSIRFNWNPPENGGSAITYNEFQCSTDSGASWGSCTWANVSSTRADATGLQAGSTYLFRVRSGNSVGVSEYSDPSPSALAASVPSTMPAPTVASKSETSISLNWDTPSSNGSTITDFVLEKSDNGGTTWTDVTDSDSLFREIEFTGLTRGAEYRFRVKAINGEGSGVFSPVLTSIPAVAPAAISQLDVISRASTSIGLSWSAPDNGGIPISNYRIRQSSDGGQSWINSTLTRSGNASIQVIATGLSPGLTYVFQVASENIEFVSGWSTSSSPALAASVPSTPSAPTISSKTATSLAIAWNAPNANGSAISDYIIESSSNNGSSWSTLSESVSTERTAELVGLTRGSTYLIRVTAVNGEGNSVASSSLSAIPAVKPLAPMNIVVNSRTTTSISISWTAPDNGGRAITGYYIQRSTDAGANWNNILLTPNDQAAFFNQSLTTGVTYHYRVAAKTPEVSNSSSAVFSEISPAALTATAPSAPTAPAIVSKNATSASVSWTAPIANGSAITGVTIEASSDSFSTIVASQNYSSSSTTHSFTGLTRGTSYQIRIKATNNEGTTTSPAVTVIPAVKPLAPTNIVANERTINAISISWDAPSDDGGRAITGYAVQRSTNLSTWATVTTLPADARAFRNGSLSSNVVYYYRVAALSPEATSATTAVFSSPSPGARTSIIPFAPINLAASVQSGTSVSLAWASGGNPGAPVTDYVIERSDDSGQTWTVVIDGTDAYLSKTITGLTQGTAYLFRVSAINLEGTGPAATLSSAIIPAAAPSVASAPTVISQSSTAIGISWDAPFDGGREITSYTVQVSGNAGVTWATAANLTRSSVTALEATVGGLTQGATYQFRISATNAMGTSGYSLASSPAKAATTPGPVSNFRQTANDNNSITVSWASAFSNGSDLTKYEVQYSRNGVNWTTVEAAGNANTIRIAGLTTSAAYEIRIRAVNLQGVGAYVQTEGATRGTTSQSISVFAANGEPVTGGSITWALNDGRARSSSGLPLNSSGLARFSLVATGLATITIEDGLLSSGATVDGTWQATFGFGSVELELPDEPLLTTKALEVSMPNGVKVPDAFVSTLSGFYSGMYVSGFSFYAPSPGISGYTDKDGTRTLVGYSVGDPVAVITYDDSVLSQTIDVILSEQNTEVELPLMPWVTAPEVNKNIVAGEADTVLFTANAVPEVEVMALGITDELNPEVATSSVSTLAFEPGVRVTVVPPIGAVSSPYGCSQILSALTNANGVATLKICPSVSGEYKVVTAGAVASKPLVYNVLSRPAPAVAPAPALIPSVPIQNSAPAPVAAPAPAAVAANVKPTMRLKQRTPSKSLANQIGMSVPKKAKVTLKVSKSSRKICRVTKGRLVALKPGNCSVTVSVTPKKTKSLKKPKTIRQSTLVRIG